VAEKLESQQGKLEHERHEEPLRATAALRYPEAERTPELQERIEATIRRKVATFIEEHQVRAYEVPSLSGTRISRRTRRANATTGLPRWSTSTADSPLDEK
jgi:hypothetical protein